MSFLGLEIVSIKSINKDIFSLTFQFKVE